MSHRLKARSSVLSRHSIWPMARASISAESMRMNGAPGRAAGRVVVGQLAVDGGVDRGAERAVDVRPVVDLADLGVPEVVLVDRVEQHVAGDPRPRHRSQVDAGGELVEAAAGDAAGDVPDRLGVDVGDGVEVLGVEHQPAVDRPSSWS